MSRLNIAIGLVACMAATSIYATTDTTSPIPKHAIGTWIYNSTWKSDGESLPWTKSDDIDGLWVNSINDFNKNNKNHPIDQIIYYGGDLEAYCDGTEQPLIPGPDDPDLWVCSSNSFHMTYWGPYSGTYKLGDPNVDTSKEMNADIKKLSNHKKASINIKNTCMSLHNDGRCNLAGISNDFWDDYIASDNVYNTDTKQALHVSSGNRDASVYKNIASHPTLVADIDGRLDVSNVDDDYLDGLNKMYGDRKIDAVHLADFVAKNICADDKMDGVQFDLEPFCFNGTCGKLTGADASGRNGQYYFYQEIAKDLAGYYGHSDDPAGINQTTNTYGDYSDPLHCVDRSHPNGRFFSTFTFASKVTPDVGTVFTRHNNGLIVDSLYDLSTDTNVLQQTGSTSQAEPGGSPLCPTKSITVNRVTYPAMSDLVTTEIQDMYKVAHAYNLPYQFAIPGGASAHEFESRDQYDSNGNKIDTINTSVSCGQQVTQGDYIKADLNAIIANSAVKNDPNYRGYDIYGWSQQSWWTDTSTTSGAHFKLNPGYPSSTSTAWANGDGIATTH